MAEVLLGGAFGLSVAVVSQWIAIGGREKRSRSVIRDELELLKLLEPGDPAATRLRIRVDRQLDEYLTDPRPEQARLPAWLLAANLIAMSLGLIFWGVATDLDEDTLSFAEEMVLGSILGFLGFAATLAQVRLWRRIRS